MLSILNDFLQDLFKIRLVSYNMPSNQRIYGIAYGLKRFKKYEIDELYFTCKYKHILTMRTKH